MSDPRLNGRLRLVRNEGFHGLQDRVWPVSARIDNALGSGRGYRDRDFRLRQTVLLRGTGAYEGLSALLYVDDMRGTVDYHGIILPCDLPSTPDLPGPPAE